MGERKVLNKYYPPDFDPAKIPRMRKPKDLQYKVRLMAPFNMRCVNCYDYIYKGKKFNAMKETVQGEDYLGIRIFRFYIKCPKCSGDITFKTDPQKADYVCEQGATRNFEPWRQRDEAIEAEKKKREEEEENNPMKALENRTLDSKREMDILDALEELKDINARHAALDHDALLSHVRTDEGGERALQAAEEEDEALVRAAFGERQGGVVHRIEDSDSDDAERPAKRHKPEDVSLAAPLPVTALGSKAKLAALVKRPQKQEPSQSKAQGAAPATAPPPAPAPAPAAPVAKGALGALLSGYGSDSD